MPSAIDHVRGRIARTAAALTSRLARERQTIRAMTALYCRRHHGTRGRELCDACVDILDYALARLDRCPYGEIKPTCVRCPVHCYRPAQRERVREVMRFAGPRMLLRHPLLTALHLLDGQRDRLGPPGPPRQQR